MESCCACNILFLVFAFIWQENCTNKVNNVLKIREKEIQYWNDNDAKIHC